MKSGWETKKLKDIAEYTIGLTYSPSDVGDEGTVVLRSSNVQDGKLDLTDIVRVKSKIRPHLYVQPGDILMCSRNGSKRLVGKATVIGNLSEQMTFGTFMTVIRSQYNPYLSWFFVSDLFREQIGIGENPMINQITKYMLDDINVPVPPIEEQRRIVAILDEAFACIDKAKANTEKNIQNARELFDSYLNNIFANPGPDWEASTLEDSNTFIDYRGKTPVKTESGVRLITAKNVKPGYLTQEPEEFIATSNYKSWMTRGIPQQGDILFTTEAPLANVAQLDTDEKVAFAQRIIILQPNRKKLNDRFLKYQLLSRPAKEKILKHGSGATVQGIKAKLLKKVRIDFPVKVFEQQEMADRLDIMWDECWNVEDCQYSKIDELGELKKSILQKAFSGELTAKDTTKSAV